MLVIPGALLFPLKVLTIWLIAYEHFLWAALVFAFAKLTGLGVTAFVFEATRPKLLQMAWFRWLYGHILIWLACAHELVDPIRLRIRSLIRSCGRSGRAARCVCSGASVAACGRRRLAGLGLASHQVNGVRREQPDRHERQSRCRVRRRGSSAPRCR